MQKKQQAVETILEANIKHLIKQESEVANCNLN